MENNNLMEHREDETGLVLVLEHIMSLPCKGGICRYGGLHAQSCFRHRHAYQSASRLLKRPSLIEYRARYFAAFNKDEEVILSLTQEARDGIMFEEDLQMQVLWLSLSLAQRDTFLREVDEACGEPGFVNDAE
jgi:hypothetical protein